MKAWRSWRFGALGLYARAALIIDFAWPRGGGMGFDKERREKVCRPFQRLHSPTDVEGSGIGVAICKRLMERHGGSIRAESQAGVGATMCLSSPIRDQRGAGKKEAVE